MKSFLKILFLMMLCAVVSAETPSQAQPIDKVVAVVNDTVITQSQLAERLADVKKMTPPNIQLPPDDKLKKQILEDEINLLLQLQIAKTANIEVSDKQVEAAIANIAKMNQLTVPELKEKLKEQGMSYERYAKQIHDQYVIHRLQQQELLPTIQITQQEVQDYLRKHPNPPISQASRYHVMDYLVSVPEQSPPSVAKQAEFFAQNVASLLRAGKTIPIDMQVQVNDLGWRAPQELPSLFQPTVIKLSKNDVSQVIKADNGYHVLQLIEVEGGKSPVVEEVHLRQIFLKEDALNDPKHIKERFTQIRANILSGGDFAKIAKAVSQDPNSSIEGGDLGWLRPGAYEPELEAAVRSLKINEISGPIKVQQGWTIVQLLGKRQVQDIKSLREVEARNAIFEKKFQEKIKIWLEQAHNQAYIKIY